MYIQSGKTFIATVIAVVLALGGLAWVSSGNRKAEPAALAQSNPYAQPSAEPVSSANDSSSNASGTSPGQSTYEDGYRAGYRDGHQDCSTTARASSGVRRSYYAPRAYAPRTRVAGARYYASPRRGHSTRNMILTIAGPAAVGAGIGGIARGGKGAGIGALLGGGGGALYYLIKHRRD
jgi:hypothetical protein